MRMHYSSVDIEHWLIAYSKKVTTGPKNEQACLAFQG